MDDILTRTLVIKYKAMNVNKIDLNSIKKANQNRRK